MGIQIFSEYVSASVTHSTWVWCVFKAITTSLSERPGGNHQRCCILGPKINFPTNICIRNNIYIESSNISTVQPTSETWLYHTRVIFWQLTVVETTKAQSTRVTYFKQVTYCRGELVRFELVMEWSPFCHICFIIRFFLFYWVKWLIKKIV